MNKLLLIPAGTCIMNTRLVFQSNNIPGLYIFLTNVFFCTSTVLKECSPKTHDTKMYLQAFRREIELIYPRTYDNSVEFNDICRSCAEPIFLHILNTLLSMNILGEYTIKEEYYQDGNSVYQDSISYYPGYAPVMMNKDMIKIKLRSEQNGILI